MHTDSSEPKRHISRDALLLLLLGVEPSGGTPRGISGITRLQKLLFLLWKEAGVEEVEGGFQFKAYKAGPYSRKLYDELELLENVGFIRSEIQGEASEAEAADLDALSFEDLMGDDLQTFADVEAPAPDVYEERRFTLTPQGIQAVKELLADSDNEPFVDGIRKIKSKFCNYSLQDLLYHVYTKYESEGWVDESEIKDKVLRKGRQY